MNIWSGLFSSRRGIELALNTIVVMVVILIVLVVVTSFFLGGTNAIFSPLGNMANATLTELNESLGNTIG